MCNEPPGITGTTATATFQQASDLCVDMGNDDHGGVWSLCTAAQVSDGACKYTIPGQMWTKQWATIGRDDKMIKLFIGRVNFFNFFTFAKKKRLVSSFMIIK